VFSLRLILQVSNVSSSESAAFSLIFSVLRTFDRGSSNVQGYKWLRFGFPKSGSASSKAPEGKETLTKHQQHGGLYRAHHFMHKAAFGAVRLFIVFKSGDTTTERILNSEKTLLTTDFCLFREYVTYCHKNGLKPKRKAEFVMAMGNFWAGAEKFRRRPEKGDNPAMAWR